MIWTTDPVGGVDVAWEHFAHRADIGVRGIGATLGEPFEQAALAMTAVITEPAESLRSLPSTSVVKRPTSTSFSSIG